jgi:hypothetical protein
MPNETARAVGSTPSGGTPESINVRLKWGTGFDLPTVYVNQLNINHAEGQFYLTFGELVLPPFTTPADLPMELEIRPRVRLAIAPARMLEMVKAIQTNVQTFASGSSE